MDTDRFDAFIRSIGIAAPRRVALGSILGAGLATLFSRFGANDAHARKKKRKKKKKCKGGKKKCGKTCVNLATNGANCGSCGHACPSGGCVNGACTCETLMDCPEACVSCGFRQDGGSACRGPGGTQGICSGDADCPIGSFCLDTFFVCSEPC